MKKSLEDMKQSCQLDRKEGPCGKMEDLFHRDLCAFAREMNPSVGWKE
jgi:hypothetical protein